MRMGDLLLIAFGGAIGAVARYALGRQVAEWLGVSFPYGTLVINLSGSFLLGLFLTLLSDWLVLNPEYRLLVAVGFCGAYTTFSTWTYETASLIERGASLLALVNLFGSLVLGMIAVYAGIVIGRWLAP